MMKNVRFLVLFLGLAFVGGCATKAKVDSIICDRCYTPEPKCVLEQHPRYINDDEAIVLQDLNSRILAYCYDSNLNSAEYCAQEFEKLGYTRLRDIPFKTADYDVLKTDTYPTRRWRNGELTPRW